MRDEPELLYTFPTPVPLWLRRLGAAVSYALIGLAVVAIFAGAAVGILGTLGVLAYLAFKAL